MHDLHTVSRLGHQVMRDYWLIDAARVPTKIRLTPSERRVQIHQGSIKMFSMESREDIKPQYFFQHDPQTKPEVSSWTESPISDYDNGAFSVEDPFDGLYSLAGTTVVGSSLETLDTAISHSHSQNDEWDKNFKLLDGDIAVGKAIDDSPSMADTFSFEGLAIFKPEPDQHGDVITPPFMIETDLYKPTRVCSPPDLTNKSPLPQPLSHTVTASVSSGSMYGGERRISDSRLSLQDLSKVLDLEHDQRETANRESQILKILKDELGFELGLRTWVRDTKSDEREKLIGALFAIVQERYNYGYSKDILEKVVRRASYYMMQGRLRRERRHAERMHNAGNNKPVMKRKRPETPTAIKRKSFGQFSD